MRGVLKLRELTLLDLPHRTMSTSTIGGAGRLPEQSRYARGAAMLPALQRPLRRANGDGESIQYIDTRAVSVIWRSYHGGLTAAAAGKASTQT